MSDCIDASKLTPQEFGTKAAELAKASGMDEKCVKASETEGANFAATADVGWGLASATVGGSAFHNKMSESGCGQFALNLTKQMNASLSINCQMKSTSNNVESSQVTGNSISFRTTPLTAQEEANKAKIAATKEELIKNASNLAAQMIAKGVTDKQLQQYIDFQKETIKGLDASLKTYERNIVITGSKIIQIVHAKQTSSIDIKNVNMGEIKQLTTTIATAAAENNMAQSLGVNSLSPEMKSVISNEIQNSNTFTNQNIEKVINSVQLNQSANNTLELVAPGNIELGNTVISQTIVADMVTKALISSSMQTGVEVVNKIKSDAISKAALEGDSKGLDELVKQQNEGNKNLVLANKSSMGGMIFVAIILIVFGVGFGAIKSTASLAINNAVFFISAVAIVAGVVYFSKDGASNKVMGVIMLLVGLGGLGFGFMLRMRSNVSSLKFSFE